MSEPPSPRVLRFGQAVPRFEDARFLTGQGRYVSDLSFPNAAVAKVFRSPYAAGRVRRLDVSAARNAPGVLAVLTATEAKADGLGAMAAFMQRTKADGSPGFEPDYGILADEAVHHVGEALAFVVAEDEATAAAALELIELEVETALAVTDIQAALAPGAPAVWSEEPSNICFVEPVGQRDGIDDAFAAAEHVVERDYAISRIIAAPMETRSAVGEFDAATGRYTLHAGTQAPHLMRNEIAQNVLGVTPEDLRILSPDIGGGFGLKVSAQREMALVLWAARRLGRPVRWLSERADAFLGDHHARDNFARVALALDGEGRFLGLRLKLCCAMGAYIDTFALHIMVNNVGGVAGPYRIGAFDVEVSGVFTNTQPVGPYRGAGRPEATYCIERIIDDAARELGLDPVDLRRRNMIPPAAMPYATGLTFVYDCGEFERVMDSALSLAEPAGLDARREAAAKRGLLHGLGVAYAVEIAGGPQDAPGPEAAEIRFDAAGDATFILGSHNHGQGHETAFRQLAGDLLGLSAERVHFIFGDTDAIASGVGTFGSRTAATAGAALTDAAGQIVELARPHAATLLEARPEDIVFADGHFTVRGTDHRIGIHEVAVAAVQVAGADGFGAGAVAAPENCTYPNACHVCEVEIDPETGCVTLTRYAVVDDVGRVLNPLLLEGQFHGGIVQGIGQILHEEIVYEPGSGQQLTGSFMDYCLPRADDLPPIAIESFELPSANSPFGVKGAGEAGTVGSLPAVMNAVCDALARGGVRQFDMPATPERVWRALQEAKM